MVPIHSFYKCRRDKYSLGLIFTGFINDCHFTYSYKPYKTLTLHIIIFTCLVRYTLMYLLRVFNNWIFFGCIEY